MSISAEKYPALVLNADYRPLSYFPLSIWSWQDALKSVFLERVDIVSEYDRLAHSPSFSMKLPSVICLKRYVKQSKQPAFTRFNLFLRDGFKCQYCGSPNELTFDHVIPRRRADRPAGKISQQPAPRAICEKADGWRLRRVCFPGSSPMPLRQAS